MEMILLLVTATLPILLLYFYFKYNFWKSRGVDVPSFLPLIGHQWNLLRGKRWEYVDKVYDEFKSKRFWGFYEFVRPTLYISDPEIIKLILVKHFDHFGSRRSLNFTSKDVYIHEMMFFLQGEKHKELRGLVTPAFSSGKIKGMFPIMKDKAIDFVKECEVNMERDGFVEMLNMAGYLTLDVIGACSFGIQPNCLDLKEKSKFVQRAKNVFKSDIWTAIKFTIVTYLPGVAEFFGLTLMDEDPYLPNLVKEVIDYRKTSCPSTRFEDFLHFMTKMTEDVNDEERNTITVIAQSILFLIGGFSTTSDTLSMIVYLLAKNPEIQEKLRKELVEIKNRDGEFTYENIVEAPYLDACLCECFRMFPTGHFIERMCTKTFKIPDANLDIPENMIVGIPVFSLHHDPNYWSEPKKFQPERFLSENKHKIIPYTYLPFGLGPKNCIGMRFAQVFLKIAMATLFSTYDVKVRPNHCVVLVHSVDAMKPNDDGVQVLLTKFEN